MVRDIVVVDELEVDERQSDEKLLDNARMTTEMMLKMCPDPTQSELRKLLAIQGHMLNQIGLDMLALSATIRKGDQKMLIALKAIASSRESLKAAAGIEVLSEVDSGSGSGSGSGSDLGSGSREIEEVE